MTHTGHSGSAMFAPLPKQDPEKGLARGHTESCGRELAGHGGGSPGTYRAGFAARVAWRTGRVGGWSGKEGQCSRTTPWCREALWPFPDRPAPTPIDKSHLLAGIQRVSKIKKLVTHWLRGKWPLLPEALGAWEPSKGWAGTCRHPLTQGQVHSLPIEVERGGPTWGSLYLNSNYLSAGHYPDHSSDGNLVPGQAGLGPLLRGLFPRPRPGGGVQG
jgi:hypothetical protein